MLCFLRNQQIASIRFFLVCVRSRTLLKAFLFSVSMLQLQKRSSLHYKRLTGDKYAFVSYTTYRCLCYNYHIASSLFLLQFFEFRFCYYFKPVIGAIGIPAALIKKNKHSVLRDCKSLHIAIT